MRYLFILASVFLFGFDNSPEPEFIRGDAVPKTDFETPIEAWSFCNGEWFVDVSAYGATGDGSDEAAEIQSAFDSGNNIEFGTSLNYRIGSGLDIDVSGNQIITGNGSTLYVTTSYVADHAIDVNKSSGVTTINDLNIDGNQLLRFGLHLQSSFHLDTMTIQQIASVNGELYGVIGIEIPNFSTQTFTEMYMTGVTVTDVDSTPGGGGNCVPPNVIGCGIEGVAKALQVNGSSTPTVLTNVLLIENSTFENVWGDDADAVDMFLGTGHPEFTGSVTMNNVTVSNAGRRLVKNRISNTTWNNCTFNEVQSGNPRLYSTDYLNSLIATFNLGSDPDLTRNMKFVGCTFNGSSLEDLIVVYESQDVSFISCDMNDVRVALTEYWGDIYLLENNFDATSRFISYNVTGGWETGTGYADCNNVKSNPSWDGLTDTGFVVLDCPVAGITFTDNDQAIAAGNSVDLTHTFVPSVPATTTYTLSSDDTGVLSNAGVGVSAGTATLTITADDTTLGTYTDQMNVTVGSAGITIRPGSRQIRTGVGIGKFIIGQ